MSFWNQLCLLLWKNYLLRKRHKMRLVIELLCPLVLFLIFMWVRTKGLKFNKPHCHLVEKTMPSVGGFEFLQNFVCTLNNTCHDNFVEDLGPKKWESTVLMKFTRETGPLIHALLEEPDGIEAIHSMWSLLANIMKVWVGLESQAALTDRNVTLGEVIPDSAKKDFVSVGPLYLGLTADESEELLETVIVPSELNNDVVQEFMDDIANNTCGPESKYTFVQFSSKELFQKVCQLSPYKAQLLATMVREYLTQNDVGMKIQHILAMNRAGSNLAPSNMPRVNQQTMKLMVDLAKKFSDFSNKASKFVSNNSTGVSAFTSFLYHSLCGLSVNSNSTSFGFDNNEVSNRMDSLRDRLRDWRSRTKYIPDPEVDELCNNVFEKLDSRPFTNLLWKQIKPLIRGQILYTPRTNFTVDLMSRVDTRFADLQQLEHSLNLIMTILHRVRGWYLNNKELLMQVQVQLKKRGADSVIEKMAENGPPGFELVMLQQKHDIEKILNRFKDTDFEYIDKLLEEYDFRGEGHSHILSCIRYNKTIPFETEYEAVERGMQLLKENKLWAVVVFEDLDVSSSNGTIPKHVKYKIRMDSDKVDGTTRIRDRLTSKTPRRRPTLDLKYITNGFIYLQELIEHSFIELSTGRNVSDEVATILQQFPYPCYIYDQFIRAISRTFPLFMILSWVYASAMIVKSIVLEKELRLKEVMKVMGLSNTVIWIGWFVDSAVVMTVSTIILTIILKFGKIIEFSDFSLILVFMLCFTLATICFSFLMSTLFSRANSAAAAGGILFFISYLPYNFMLLWEERLTWHHLLFSCLISNVAFGFGCTYLARMEEDGIGAQWNRVTLKTLPDDDFNLIYCILMLLFDSFLYLVLAWYIENVFPGESGMPRKWYFLFQRSYWCPEAAGERSYNKQKRRYESGLSDGLVQESSMVTVEAEPSDLTLGVEVVNLSKTYPNGRVALSNFVMNFYEGQITSFLGHNGAGKTTAISILTGLFPPTKGTARIYGQDIRTQMSSIRKDLGICPQYNVLFDRLTVEEHLKFYSGLKGKEKTCTPEEMEKMLEDLGIPHKRHDFPSALSGGMKRKLSVACAFVGGSKTVFLDEPTSGVDPYSRRSIWELLLKYKTGRTVILTTHFMDEADILGDRIAIISQGRLVASGSSLFLKAHYGRGYSLRLVREEVSASQEELLLRNNIEPSTTRSKEETRSTAKSVALSRHTELCTKFVHGKVPEAALMDDVGSEIVYLLPYSSINSFPGLFHDLDENLATLHVSSYGISDTTLEDVFLKITAEDLEESRWDDGSRFCHACCCNPLVMSRVWKMRRSIKKRKAKIRPDSPEPPPVIVHSLDAGYISPADHVIPTVQEQLMDNGNNSRAGTPPKLATPEDTDDLDPESPNTSDATNSTLVPEEAEADNPDDPEAEANALLEPNAATTQAQDAQNMHELAITFRNDPPKRSATNLSCLQLRVILKKRFRNSIRNLRALFFEIILPVLFIALALALTLILPTPANELPRLVTPWAYPSPNYIFFAEPKDNRTGTPLTPVPKPFDGFVEEIIGPVGIGPPCTSSIVQSNTCQPIANWTPSALATFNSERRSYPGSQLGTCDCKVGSFQCTPKEEQPPPPKIQTPTGDYVLDVTKNNLSAWMLQTYNEYEYKRVGGYEMLIRTPVETSFSEFLFLMDCLTTLTKPYNQTQKLLTGKTPRKYIKVWFENRAWLSSIAYVNSLNNALLREFVAPGPSTTSSSKSDYGITLYTHPMNLTKLQQEKESLKTAALGVVHAICVIFALGFVPASFTMYLIEERQSGAKHLHLVSGVKPVVYWVAAFIFDMGKYLIPVFLCLALFYAFSAEAYIGRPSVGPFLCLLLLYGWASIPLMYPASFHFSVPSTAFVVLGCMNLFIGVISTVSIFVLEQLGDEDLEEIGDILQQVFLIFPQYCLGTGLMKLVRLHIEDTAFSRFSIPDSDRKNRFDWDILGQPLTCLAAHGVIFFLLNLIYEYKQWLFLLCKRRYKTKWNPKNPDSHPIDADVSREARRVLTHPRPDSTLIAENLTKVYRGRLLPSVNKLSFSVGTGECFGLLGVNGAGKTTTFKMLTGDVRITYGKAKIMSHDVEKSLDTARKHFGYCPQEDGLDPLLSTYEQLELYGRLRGMTQFDVREMSKRLVAALGLKRYADKRCGTYSGGNRRKVSTAIALIGNPDLVFLDEPTSGMDPGARRQLWKVILKIVHAGKSVVLTSHSMEECEALCNRLAIMVNGRFMCLGSLQHLKNRFGNGYMLTVRAGPETRQEFLEHLAAELPSAVLEDTHCSQLKFKISQADVKLGEIFSVMYKEKKAGLVEDYSVSQTTLDDIFVKFASKQRDELDAHVKIKHNKHQNRQNKKNPPKNHQKEKDHRDQDKDHKDEDKDHAKDAKEEVLQQLQEPDEPPTTPPRPDSPDTILNET